LDFEDLVDTIKKVNPNVKDIALQEFCLKYIYDCYGIAHGNSDGVNKNVHQKLDVVGFSNKMHEFLKYLNETMADEKEAMKAVKREIGEMGYDIKYGKKKRKEIMLNYFKAKNVIEMNSLKRKGQMAEKPRREKR
jgi:hypothetical protein